MKLNSMIRFGWFSCILCWLAIGTTWGGEHSMVEMKEKAEMMEKNVENLRQRISEMEKTASQSSPQDSAGYRELIKVLGELADKQSSVAKYLRAGNESACRQVFSDMKSLHQRKEELISKLGFKAKEEKLKAEKEACKANKCVDEKKKIRSEEDAKQWLETGGGTVK